jgi:tetratricopeptide (TPR) repeat protein
MFSADERVIVTTGDFTAGARAWDAANGKELMSTAGRGSAGVGAAPGPGDTLIWTERDRVRISDARTSRLIAEMNTADVDFAELMKSGRVAMSRAVFSPDGQRMAKIVNGSGYVWDIESNRTVTRLTLSPPIEVLTFASNRLLGVSRGLEREPGAMVEIWDLETRQVVTRMSHPDPLHLMAISADGRLVATPDTRRVQTFFGDELARPGATLRILASASATAVTNRAFEAPIAAAAFDPTGRHVAVATDAGVISILDAAAGEEIVRLSHDRPAAVGFSPSGRYLVTAGGDGTARVWLWRGADLAADACTRLTRNLTWAEWRDFLPSDEPYDKTCAGLPVHPSVVEAARTQARKGDLAAASAIFARAVEIEPSLGLVPDDEAKRWKAVADGEQLVKYAETLAARGEVKEAVAALARAAALLPDLDRSATPWNQVCWFGSLTGGAALVLDACAKAVAISPDNASIRDSRGLARALTGDVNGAIEDFKAFVASRPDLPEADDRRRWIDALAVGQNPFTAEVLKQLLARSR